MNFSEYRKLTVRTMSDTGSDVTDSAHMVLGLNTEIMGELPEALATEDLVNFKEELGDAFWYLANYCNIWKIDPENQIEYKPELFGRMSLKKDSGQQYMMIFGIGQIIALLQDLDKKLLAYGKKPDEAKRKELTDQLYSLLEYLAFILGIDTNAVRATNIAKLAARYPGLVYDDEHAINRDLETERNILED